MKKTVAHYVERLVDQYDGRYALTYKKEFRTQKWSYRDLYNYAHMITGFFKSKGIKKGDKVIIYCYNCPEWGAILFACALSGVIAVPIDFNSKEEFVSKIFKKSKAKIIFSSRYKILNQKAVFIESLGELVKKYHGFKCKTKIKENDILEIVYTSGTTGDPKGVIITNKNLVSNIRSIRLIMPLKNNLVFLSVVPLSHLLEQTVGFFIPLRFGCQIVYTNSRKSSTLLNAMQQEKVSSMVSVPILLKTLKNKIEREIAKKGKTKKFNKLLKLTKKFPLFLRRFIFSGIINQLSPKLDFFVVGGAPLDEDIEMFWNSMGILVLQGYGLTETSPILTCNSLSEHKEGSVGKVLPNQKVKTTSEGEIICSGDNVTQGYYQNKEATRSAIKKGWYFTGDLGEFDEDGFLTIKGRKKNMILTSSGLNVYPQDIEQIFNAMSEIKESVVLGIKSKKGIIITAILLPEKNSKINSKKIIHRVNSHLASHQQVQKIIVWSKKDFPRTPTLKIKRKDVEEGLKHINEKVKLDKSSKNQLFEILSSLSSKSISKITPKSILSTDLAIDSLHRVELLSLIEEEYNVEIEESKITEKTNVKDLLELISKTSGKKKKILLSRLNTSNYIKPLRYLIQLIFFSFLRIFYPIKIIGKENLTKIKTPVVYAINHVSHLDTPSMLRVLPMRLRTKIAFAAAQDYFFVEEGKKKSLSKRIMIPILQIILNIYPFSRGGSIRQSLKTTGQLLDRGFSIGIYPEGTRSLTGEMGAFKTGIGLIANHMDVPVIPVKIQGLQNILSKGSFWPSFGKVKIFIGKPININQESYIKSAEKIEEAVRSL